MLFTTVMKKLLLILTIVLSFVSISAQTSKEESLKEYLKKESQYDQILSSYDRFKDITKVKLTTSSSGDPLPYPGVLLIFSVEFPGKTFPKNKEIIISTVNTEKISRVHSASTLIFLANNQRIKLENAFHSLIPSKEQTTVVFGAFSITQTNFAKLANSKTLEAQFDDVEFTFSENQLQLLKQFHDKLIPQK